jgi:hypothetical protein
MMRSGRGCGRCWSWLEVRGIHINASTAVHSQNAHAAAALGVLAQVVLIVSQMDAWSQSQLSPGDWRSALEHES